MRINEICRREVVTCGRHAPVAELARLMRDRCVGDVIVVDTNEGKPVPVGIVTDRDLVVRVLAMAVPPASVAAGELMGVELVTVNESEYVYDAIWHMRSKGTRRLPVVNDAGHLVGVLTLDDLTRFLAEELGDLSRIASRQVAQERSRRAA